MAEIAVHRKKAMPWWAWLILALVVAALLWAFIGRNRERGVGDRSRTEDQQVAIRDVAMFHNGAAAESLIGRPVRIDRANVLSVTGDRTFWIGDRADRQVLVVLSEVMTPNQPGIEGRYDVNPGQTIAILEGQVTRFPGWEQARSDWNADPSLQSTFENHRVYIAAQKIDIKEFRTSEQPVQTQPR